MSNIVSFTFPTYIENLELQSSGSVWLFRFEHEQPLCKAIEEEIRSLYKVIDDANFTKVDLENQVDSMNSELLNLTKTHEEVGMQAVCVPGYSKILVLFFCWLLIKCMQKLFVFIGCETAL